ncbi:MAG TPA: metallophosphoesterase [Acidimicrobiia bacterium]|nr:metallophosphoesterase [Acidimicrobiia bacterium]
MGDRLPTFVTTHQRARRLAWSRRAVIGLCAVLLIGLSLPAATAPAAVGSSGVVDVAVAASNDDAEELPTGYLDTTSSDLELVYERSAQTVGVRFRGVTIPAGAIVDAAWIQFTVDEVSTGPAALTIRAEDAADPVAFAGTRGITTRVVSSGSVVWAPAAWPAVGVAGTDQRTPDLALLIASIVDRSDWASGNAVVLLITGTGTRTAESFDGTAAPRLHVEWHTGAVTTTTAATTTTAPGPTTTPAPTTTSSSTTTTTAAGGTAGSLTVAVTASSDDAEESTTGWLDTTSGDLELVKEKVLQTVGIRFRGITIPKGATITSAWIQFTVDEVSTGTADLTIRAQAAGNPVAFAGTRGVTSRPTTPESVHWVPAPWRTVGASGPDQRTPDLSPLVQAVVDRSDWTDGNSLALVVTGSGTRTAESFEGTGAPMLHIQWTNGGGTTTTTTTTVPVSTTTTTTMLATNQPPSVLATASPVTAGATSTLAAQISDDGFPSPPGATTILWEQIDGPTTVSIANPNAAATSAVLPSPGEYRFRATVSDGALATVKVAVATANPAATGSTRIAVIGDYGDGSTREGRVASMISDWGPDAIVTVGDNIYSTAGYDRIVGRYYHSFIGAYAGSYGAGSPTGRFFPALGNHDYADGGINDYLSFFTLPGPGVATTGTSGNERYYDVRIGDVAVFVLNSRPQEPNGLTPTTTQGQWLHDALAASDAEWKIVVVHDPPYSSIPGKSALYTRWPYQAWGADLVLSGDAHVYERLRIDGLDYAISGLGINHSTLDNPTIAGSQKFYSADDAGALFITACSGSMHLEYRALSAGVVDNYTIGSGSCP